MTAREVAEKLVNDYAQKYVDAALDHGALWTEQLCNAITAELESRDEAITAWKQTADMFCKAHEKAKEQIAAMREALGLAKAFVESSILVAIEKGQSHPDEINVNETLLAIKNALNADSGDVE